MMRADQVRAKLGRRPGTIGQLESLAGIGADEKSRREFWVRQSTKAKRVSGQAFPDGATVFEHAKGACYKLIAARVNAGELSLI